MADAALIGVLRHIRGLAGAPAQADLSDGELLARFAWLLATSGRPEIRDPSQAVAFAERACRLKRPPLVESLDALLICPRNRAQDVGKVVKQLEEQKRKDLL